MPTEGASVFPARGSPLSVREEALGIEQRDIVRGTVQCEEHQPEGLAVVVRGGPLPDMDHPLMVPR
jgi:hypothetical protein